MFIVDEIKIADAEIGMLVRSRDVSNQRDRYRLISNKLYPVVTDQVEISSADGYSICSSETHPMAFVLENGQEQYKPTCEISIGDKIITPSGYRVVSSVRNGRFYDENFLDFTVDEDNNYYAGNESGKLVLAHNSATLYYPIWHYEIENMLVLKNNKGIEDNRVRHMDYAVQFNKLFYERLIQGGDITLFSPNEVPEIYEAFFSDYDRFKELYETAERNTRLRKKKMKALDLFSMFIKERKETGRIYLMNVDHANTHSSFDEKVAPVRMSNLCCEINLATTPMGTIRTERKRVALSDLSHILVQLNREEKQVAVLGIENDIAEIEIKEDMSRIALCTLSAINWGVVKSPANFERIGRLTVRALDNLLDHQNYPVYAARKHTEEYRPLGIGIINFAYFLAKNGARYTDGSGLALVDEWAEAWSYYLIKASVELAKERGPCKLVGNTKYGKGIVPIDTRKREVDMLVPHRERLDWDGLRDDLRTYGIRNATVMALMPAETSAQIGNATNGIEPPRSYVSVKQSKHGVLKQVVPELRKLRSKYELLWDQASPEGYLHLCSILQKYIDQGISVNTSYNPKFFEEEKIPVSVLLRDILTFYKFGGKQMYYLNSHDGAGEINLTAGTGRITAEGHQATVTIEAPSSADDDCDSCKI